MIVHYVEQVNFAGQSCLGLENCKVNLKFGKK